MQRRIATQLLCGLLLMTTTELSFARMYKWVDADGNTHYTQQPPPEGIEASTIKPPAPIDATQAQEQSQNTQALLKARREARVKNNKAQREKTQATAQQKTRCEQARARLASYQRPRVNLIGKDGSPSRATEEQRQAEIKKSKEYVQKSCK